MAIKYNPYGWEIRPRRQSKEELEKQLSKKRQEFFENVVKLELVSRRYSFSKEVFRASDDLLDDLSYLLYEMGVIATEMNLFTLP